MISLTRLLLLAQVQFFAISLSYAEEPEENVVYPYPFVYDTDDTVDEDKSDRESKPESSKKESKNAWHGKLGAAEVTIDVENTDFISQHQAERERIRKKNAPEKEKKSSSKKDDDDEEKDHSPHVKFSIKWGDH